MAKAKPASKPPYRVPSMAEIRKVKPSGLTVASTFSGCGGSCLGFKMAGFRHVYANEFVPAARETYAANFPGVHLDDRDIRKVTAADVLKVAGLKKGQLDVLEGSPPCASFSTAGKRSRGWGEVKKYSDVEQRADDLFFEFVRLLKGLAPRAFVAENVSGLVKGVAKGYFLEILAELKAAGYRVSCRVLDAQWLGVPQQRARTIFVGVREDLKVDPAHPAPLPYRYTIREAFASGDGPQIALTKAAKARRAKGTFHGKSDWNSDDVSPTIGAGSFSGSGSGEVRISFRTGWSRGERISADAPAPTLMAGGIGGSSSDQCEVRAPAPESIERFAIGPEWEKLRPGEQSERYFNLVWPHPDAPVPTVTASGGALNTASVTHPNEPRKFTIAELRRLGGFPDDFILTGTYRQQWERIGRAVPPVMMFHVARALRDEVFGKMKRR